MSNPVASILGAMPTASDPPRPSLTRRASAPKISLEDAVGARVGSTLNGKWRLDALIGSGGMASVYAVTHRNGRRCAVKILHPHLARAPEQRARFLREGKIANHVDHRARVAVLDDDESEHGEPFLVMELLSGETLSARLARRAQPLGTCAVLRIFDTVLDLLAACHAAGVVHRDIKPQNLFLTEDDGVKVIDFGIAQMREAATRDDRTRAGVALGTASYMAPEQALGGAIDGRVDLFSVGACIYHALSGVRVHGAVGDDGLVRAATQSATALGEVAPHVPREIATFVDKAVAFHREDRYESARAMQLELRLLLAALDAGFLVERISPPLGSDQEDSRTLGAEADTIVEMKDGYYRGGAAVREERPFDSQTRIKVRLPANRSAELRRTASAARR